MSSWREPWTTCCGDRRPAPFRSMARGNSMAMQLPQALEIADSDEQQPCRFCGHPLAADPDDIERWTSHLTVWHGYRVVQDRPRTGTQPRVVRLELVGWSGEAQFEPNQRVMVKPDSQPWDYA